MIDIAISFLKALFFWHITGFLKNTDPFPFRIHIASLIIVMLLPSDCERIKDSNKYESL